MIYELPEKFIIQELVPEVIYDRFGDRSIKFFDRNIIRLLHLLPKRYSGKIYLNNWEWGGNRDEAGYRIPTTDTGSEYSQHKLGRAIDPKFSDYSADEIREDIIKNQELFIALGVTTIEHKAYAPTWVHIDCRITNQESLLIVKPAA